MRIELLFFAQLKEALGRDRETLELDEGDRVDDVLRVLSTRTEWARVGGLPLSFAVNEEIVGGTRELHDGDRLALLPPVSGG